jgi:hypothetical protein
MVSEKDGANPKLEYMMHDRFQIGCPSASRFRPTMSWPEPIDARDGVIVGSHLGEGLLMIPISLPNRN